MSKEKNILLLTPGFPKDENDYLCIPPLQDFLITLKKNFPAVNITVAAFQYPFTQARYNWNNISVFSFGGRNSKLEKIFVWDSALTLAKYLKENNQLDIVHSLWFGECAFVGNRISSRFNIKHICTLMGQDVSTKNYYLRLLNKNKLTVVSLSQNQSELFRKITGRNVDDEIFWGVHNQRYDSSKKREIDLLGVGSLINLKNFKVFINVVHRLKSEFPSIRSMIIGDGNLRNKLSQQTKLLGLQNNIEFTGSIKRSEVFEFMKRSKILLHPSLFEGSGLVFAEALANGMHIASYNVGYAKENNKWNIAKNEDELYHHCRNLLNKNLSFEPMNIFPIEETVNRYAKLYGLFN
jgi:glycosyltransferase involved in cell wall biosynthesis